MILALGALAIAAAAWMRLAYGVDFTDEADYVAMPYAFSLGNHPFVDEHTLQQTAAVLMTPLVRAHGTSEGLFLFFRRGWFVLALVTGLVVFLKLRKTVPIEAAIAAAIVPIAFIPFSIPSLSYNTIGMLLLTMGLFAAFSGTRILVPPLRLGAWLALGVTALAAACFAYPTLIIAAAPACLALLIVDRRQRGALVAILATALTAILAVALFVTHVGLPAIREAVAYHRAFGVQGGGVAKLTALARDFEREMPHLALVVLAIFAAAVPKRLRAIPIAALTIALVILHKQGAEDAPLTVVYAVALFTPAVLRYARGPLLLVWIASIVAAIATAWTSSNGLPNAAIGALPALITTIAILGDGWASIPFLILLASIHAGAWRSVYRDDPVPKLTERIGHGPYAGLRTTGARRAELEAIERDVVQFAKGRRTILFYDHFPAGYLMSRLRPYALAVFTPTHEAFPRFDRTWYTRFYRHRVPDVVFEFRDAGGYATDPFRDYFWTHGARIAVERDDYTVYTRCDCPPPASFEAESMDGASHGNDYAAGWGSYPADYSGGRAAITTKSGAEMTASIPNFRPGDHDVDLSFYSYGGGAANEVVLALGDNARTIRFTCGKGLHRVAGIRFHDVQTPSVAIRAGAIGQSALIIDRIVVRNAVGPESLAANCATVGPETAKPEIVEAEGMAADGWTSYAVPMYSAGRAAITTKPGAVITGTFPHFRPGDYVVTVIAYSYGGAMNEFAVTLGGETKTIHVGPLQGILQVPLEFRGVRSPRISIRATKIAQPAAIIDAITLQAPDRVEDLRRP